MEEEFAPDSSNDVVDNRPLEERIGDKNWKTRQTAYDDLKKEVSLPEGERSPSVFSVYASWLTKMTADSNASALDSGLDTALAFVETAPAGVCQVHNDKLFANIVDKTFSGRASTLTKGKALMHKLIEVDEAGACTAFLLTKLADKKPKIPPTSLDILKEGIESYGVKAFPVKEIIKALPAVFNGTNSAARDSAMALTVEIYRWIRLAPLQSMLDGLRTAQKSDFEKIIAEKGETFGAVPPEPTVYLRKERPSPEAAAAKAAAQAERAAGAGQAGGAVAVPDGADGREYVDEVDILKKLRNSEYATLIAEEKWSEQLKGLQLVIDAIGPVPKIKAGTDVHDILQTIKGFLRQGHLQIQVASLKILCLLADGLRKEFGSSLRPLLQQVVQKSKEKRLVVEVQAVLNTAFLHCLPYDVVNEDVIEFVSSKKSPPHGKIGLLEVVVKTFSTLPDKVNSDSLKPLATILVVECEDSDPKVREAAAQALAAIGTLAKSRGRLAADASKLISNLENSNAKVYKKVQALMEGGGGSGGDAGAGLGGSMKSTSSSASMVKKLSTTSNSAASSSTTSLPKASTVSMNATTGTVSVKKAAPASSSTATSSNTASTKRAAGSASNSAANNAEDDAAEDITLSVEEAVLQLAPMNISGWTETGLPGMESAKWQDKVDALTAIENRCAELGQEDGSGVYTIALVKYISSTSTGFKISNINILKATIQCCGAIVKNHNGTSNSSNIKFSRAAGWELLKHLGEKLNDKKTKDGVQTLLTALADTCSVTFVLKRMKAVLEKCVSPVAHQYYLEWVKEAIGEFGCGAFPVPVLCAFCQVELENKNAAVRTAAVECMGALYHQVGPRLTAVAFTEDMKPQLKALLEAEFAKVGHDPAAAGRAPRAASVNSSVGGSGVNEKGGGAAAGGGIPRQDLCSLVGKDILTELAFTDSKTSWQRRKAAMESIVSACERSAHYLEANKPTGEIVKALKPRMSDTQANLKPLAVAAIAHVVASLDSRSAGAKVLATMAPAMMIGLADNKKSMRDSTIYALQHAVSGVLVPGPVEGDNYASFAAADSGMLMSTVPAAAESLVNVVGRQELLLWLIHHVPSLKGDCTDLVTPLVLTLQDKNAGVRASGEALLTQLLAHSLTTRVALDKATRDLPPATKRAMQACIDRMMNAYGTAPKAAVSTGPATSGASSSAAVSEPAAASVNAPVPVVAAAAPVPAVVDTPPTPPRPTTTSSSNVYNTSPPIAPAPVESHSASSSTPAQARRPVAATPTTTTHTTTNTATAPPTASANWLLKRNAVGKLRRMEEFTRLNWPQPPDEPSDTEIAALKVVWRPIVTPDLAFLLFPIVRPGSPVNQDVYVPAMNELSTQLTCPYLTHHTEFLLRWCCIVLCLKHESGPGLLRLLQLLCDLFEAVRVDAENNTLSESEVLCILPHLVDRCGHRSDKHQQLIVYAISLLCELTAPAKVMLHLSHGLHSHNKRSRVVCLGEMSNLILSHGNGVISGSVVHSVVTYLDSKDIDVAARGACLDLLVVVYNSVQDGAKFKKLVGNDVSEKTLTAIEDKINGKSSGVHSTPHTAHTTSRTPAKTATPAHAVAHTPVVSAGSSSTHPTIDTSNEDAWAISNSKNSALVSPGTEMRTNAILLEQIDSVMASTPLPQRGAPQEASSAQGSVPQTPEQVLVSTVHTPLTTHSAHPVTAPHTAHTAHPTTTAPNTTHSTHTTASSIVDPDELQDSISALPVEFRSPVASPAITKYKARVSMSGMKGAADEPSGLSELDGLYLDIEQKVDALLQKVHPIHSSDPLQEECKDYLKMLHSIVNGEWSAEKSEEDDRVLLLHSDALIVRLIGCIERSFNVPTIDSSDKSSTGGSSIQGVDVSLLAISLSVLFSMVKRAEVSSVLTEDTLFAVFHECLLRICDARITTLATQADALGTESKETAQQVARALNNIVLKLGMLGTAGPVLLAMLRVMFCCIPAAELPYYADHKALPNSSTKPASRLVIQILSEHGNKANPYSEPEVQLVPLLEAIHHFFTRHPTSTSNDTPFRTVKTVLNEIVLVKGGNSVLGTLKTTPIPHTAFIYLLTCRLGNVSMHETDTDLNAKIVAVIDDITSSRDKLAAIKELHKIKTANPNVDINTYLHKISTAFRRYVLNTLAKLDEGEGSASSSSAAVSSSTAGTAVSSSAVSGGTSHSSGSGTPVKALLGSVASPEKPAPVTNTTNTSNTTAAVDTPAPHEYASARSTPASAASAHTTYSTHSLDYSPIDPNTSPVIASTTPYTKNAAAYTGSGASTTPYGTYNANSSSSTTPYADTNSSTGYALSHPADDQANEALRILEGIKARPGQITADAPAGLEGSARSYSLEHTPRAAARTPTRPVSTAIDTSSPPAGELSVGKHKRFAYNPETKRMEIVMVSSSAGGDVSPSHSPTGLMAGDNSPFARRNDIIRNSLSSLTAQLDLPRNNSGEFRSTTGSLNSNHSGVAIDEDNLEARIQRLLSPKGSAKSGTSGSSPK